MDSGTVRASAPFQTHSTAKAFTATLGGAKVNLETLG